MEKSDLRQYIRQLKHTVAPEQLCDYSKQLATMLEAHPWFREATHVMLFASLPDEPDTRYILEKYAATKRLYLPAVVGEDIEVRPYRATSTMEVGPYAISQPLSETLTDLTCLELIVTPGVAFDRQGHRLGRGRGYYDRLFARPDVQARRLGYAFPFQIVDNVPAHVHDIPMHDVLIIDQSSPTTIQPKEA
ncbi:MAG: 5-formyltetrahydrofolate cyclo-ligase [Bacteroidaceae bacterium]|nr:5-formyltetrahydrofolate cyclo-ligase [Bacteroidaceae bacterium]